MAIKLGILAAVVTNLPTALQTLAASPPASASPTGETEARNVEELIIKDEKGRIRCLPLPMPEQFRNPWTPELEEEFWERAQAAIRANATKGKYGGTFFESEKWSYPRAMMDFIAGNRETALKFLQEDDNQAYNRYTFMVDFYPCFTLKGQMRKYFYFGRYLSPEYRQKMFAGAKVWTATDPYTRPHPLATKTKPGQGFMPEATGMSVDLRNTDNLQAMRETAIYLMAEETGNEAVRKLYAEKLIRNVRNMYRCGMGEWDSNNYHGHTMTGYIQLHDFARDEQMRLVGKAAMDYLCVTGAFKYYRGGFGGPSKRDYNHPVVHSGCAADHLGLYFGDYPGENDSPSFDNVHFITSAYRPPLAVVAMARKQFPKPVEVFVSHPHYNALRAGAKEPAYFETMYFGHTFTFGTLATGTDGPGGDVNGFKLLAWNSRRGTDFFIANTTTNPRHIGSAQYTKDDTFGSNNVAQLRNLAIWLNPKPDCPFLFFLPKTARIEMADALVLIALEKTWLALWPINLRFKGVDAALTEQANFTVTTNRKTGDTERTPKWPLDQIMAAEGTGGPVCGFAIEVGEPQTHGDFAAFRQAVLGKAELGLGELKNGVVEFAGASGGRLKIKYGAPRPTVWRDGQEHRWERHTGLYIPADGGRSPIYFAWGSGKLHVEAGGHAFDASFSDDGRYSFANGSLPTK
jgi:hypothetical protein